MRPRVGIAVAILVAGTAGFASAQEGGGGQQSRIDKLSRELERLRTETDEALEEMSSQLEAATGGGGAGSTKFLLAGYGSTDYTNKENANSSFTTKFLPIFLWELDERTLFESEVEIELEGGATEVGLEFADITHILNDYMTIRAGKFMSPVSRFKEYLHPSWINKLPDQPLYATGSKRLIPTSELGVEVRGAIPFEDKKVTYSVYLSNGPSLKTGASDAGRLSFKNFDDVDNNKAFGVAIGFLPMPELEVGGSFQIAGVGASGTTFGDIDATTLSANLHYRRDWDAIKGDIDLLAEWVWVDVDDATYDPTGAAGIGPLTFDNQRDGGYIQFSYRPLKASEDIVKNLEFVARYDALNMPVAAPGGADEARITLGVNYRLNPSTILKAAYQNDDVTGGQDTDAVLLQIAMGF